MVHAVKTIKPFYQDCQDGMKTFDSRLDDRNYQVGDYLAQNEYEDGEYTGRATLYKIIYKLKDGAYCKDGYAILGIQPCFVKPNNELMRTMGYLELEKGGVENGY